MTFEVGRRVRISSREHDGHHRTPGYVKGRSGIVVGRHGAFRNPETRAYGADGLPEQPLYLVALLQKEVWPRYDGAEGDRVYVDVFEQWLQEDE